MKSINQYINERSVEDYQTEEEAWSDLVAWYNKYAAVVDVKNMDAFLKELQQSSKKGIKQIKESRDDEWTWEDECNSDGKISAEIGVFSAGGREHDKAYFELEKLSEDKENYQVKAVCVDSELRKIKKGYELEFDLPKDCSVWDIDSYLQDAIDDDTNYGGRG